MKIRLKNAWYINSTYYAVGDHEVPNELYEFLPSTAEFVKDSLAETKKEDQFVSLRDLDVERSKGEREEAFVKGKK